MTYTDVRHLGTSSHEWISALDFYQEDLDILDSRLLEVAKKNTGKDVAVSIEHFQNQFSIQRQNISDLRHRIQGNNKQAARDVQLHANHVSSDVLSDKAVISGDMKRFEDTMKELRHAFNVFLSKWM